VIAFLKVLDKYPDIPWSKIIGMRNLLLHNYFKIDVDVVWTVIMNEFMISNRKLWRECRKNDLLK